MKNVDSNADMSSDASSHATGQSQRGCTQRAVRHYLENLNGHDTVTNDLYDLVIAETEKGMITEVLSSCEGNQSRAAIILGITRTTLRSKIRKLGL